MAYRNDEERKAYYREYNKDWYQRHKERLHQKRKQHDADLRVWLIQYKSQIGCMDCGENHPACLQFHHRDRETKSFNIGGIIGQWRYITLERLKEEIAKCDILCGNCHALRHWKEGHNFDSWLEVFSVQCEE
jgi:L-lactate utilization protein LutB